MMNMRNYADHLNMRFHVRDITPAVSSVVRLRRRSCQRMRRPGGGGACNTGGAGSRLSRDPSGENAGTQQHAPGEECWRIAVPGDAVCSTLAVENDCLSQHLLTKRLPSYGGWATRTTDTTLLHCPRGGGDGHDWRRTQPSVAPRSGSRSPRRRRGIWL